MNIGATRSSPVLNDIRGNMLINEFVKEIFEERCESLKLVKFLLIIVYIKVYMSI